AGRQTPSAAGHPPSSRLIGHAVRPRGSALRVVPVVLILSATLIVVLVGGSALVAVLTLPTIVLGRRIRTRRGLLCAGFGTCIGFGAGVTPGTRSGNRLGPASGADR